MKIDYNGISITLDERLPKLLKHIIDSIPPLVKTSTHGKPNSTDMANSAAQYVVIDVVDGAPLDNNCIRAALANVNIVSRLMRHYGLGDMSSESRNHAVSSIGLAVGVVLNESAAEIRIIKRDLKVAIKESKAKEMA